MEEVSVQVTGKPVLLLPTTHSSRTCTRALLRVAVFAPLLKAFLYRARSLDVKAAVRPKADLL
jgi:hypothetical protein